MAKNLGKFSIFQAKNADFFVEYLDNDDEFRQGTIDAPRYRGALSIPLEPLFFGFAQDVLARGEIKKHTGPDP